MTDQSTDRPEVDVAASEVPPLGAVLRAAREMRGLSLSEVARALKLSIRQLEAIEQERFSELPGPAFVKGFVRNYGRYVGVDVEPMIAARWAATSTSAVELKPMTNAAGTLPVSGERSRGRKLLFPLVLVLVLTAALAWYFDGFDPYSGAGPETPAAGVGTATEVEPPAVHEGPGEEAVREAESLVVPPPIEAPAPAGEPLPVPASPSGEAAPAPAEVPQGIVQSPAAPAAGEAVVEAADAPVESAPGRLVFRVESESWLEVRDRSDRRLYSGLSAAGSVRVVQGQRPFVITIGNAGAVKLEHAGREVDLRPHTSSGGVARLKLE